MCLSTEHARLRGSDPYQTFDSYETYPHRLQFDGAVVLLTSARAFTAPTPFKEQIELADAVVRIVVVLTILMTVVWDMVFPGRVYYCTDHVGFDYLHPGHWVHGEVEIVDEMTDAFTRSMSEPNVMLRGWTMECLWWIWGLMFGSSRLGVALCGLW